MAAIEFEQVRKRYRDGTEAVKGIDLTIGDGELMVLVGPSGCGKTTALRMLAGLEEISSGVIRIGDRVVNDLSPKDRDIAMVFQNYALYPHMTVRENMGFALRLAKVGRADIDKRVSDAAATLDLTTHLDRKPANLSGGQRQRVAMGRAIVRAPQAFLMDEPLSNLDAKLRVQMRIEVARLQQRLGTTTVFVTHDQTEAMTLGHRVAVLRDGLIQQVDAPQRLYEDPVNVFVAGFIGSPPMNLLPARLIGDRIRLPFGEVRLPDRCRARLDRTHADGNVVAGIRPEAFADAADANAAGDLLAFTTRIDVIESVGPELYAYFDVESRVALPDDVLDPLGRGEGTALGPHGNTRQLVARLPVSARVSPGHEATLLLDPAELRLFDATTGQSLLTIPSEPPASANGRHGDPHHAVAQASRTS